MKCLAGKNSELPLHVRLRRNLIFFSLMNHFLHWTIKHADDALTVITDIQRDLNIPIIMVTHNCTEAEKVATRIYKIEKGRFI